MGELDDALTRENEEPQRVVLGVVGGRVRGGVLRG